MPGTGTVVPSGTLVSPSGSQGTPGTAAIATVITPFTVPAVGSTVNVTVNDASWMVVGQMINVDQAGGVGLSGALQVQSKSGNNLVLYNPPPPSAIPPADATQPGLLNRLSGLGTDYVGGDNACHPLALANASGSGLLAQLSGNATDYVGGDNACHPILQPFYGTDTSNNLNYVVTVDSSFQLLPGVMVTVKVNNQNTAANPTLNVNGTGALGIYTRGGQQIQSAFEIPSYKSFVVVYDGTKWVLVTPVSRYYAATNPGNVSVSCAGYDSIAIQITFSAASSCALQLTWVTPGIPILVTFANGYSAANNYSMSMTDTNGTAITCYWNWANALTGAGSTNLATAVALGAGTRVTLVGSLVGGIGLFL